MCVCGRHRTPSVDALARRERAFEVATTADDADDGADDGESDDAHDPDETSAQSTGKSCHDFSSSSASEEDSDDDAAREKRRRRARATKNPNERIISRGSSDFVGVAKIARRRWNRMISLVRTKTQRERTSREQRVPRAKSSGGPTSTISFDTPFNDSCPRENERSRK